MKVVRQGQYLYTVQGFSVLWTDNMALWVYVNYNFPPFGYNGNEKGWVDVVGRESCSLFWCLPLGITVSSQRGWGIEVVDTVHTLLTCCSEVYICIQIKKRAVASNSKYCILNVLYRWEVCVY